MKKTLFSSALALFSIMSFGQWTEIITDSSDDSAGIDGTLLEYQYNMDLDKVIFRVTVEDAASFSSSPSADFSFYLPNGLESGGPTGTHWTSTTEVHKTAYIYCDLDGAPPISYTYTDWSQSIEETSSGTVLCTGCVEIFVDVPSNQITYTFNRTDIISDVEMDGESTVTIGLVANLGHDIGWDDAITHESGGASTATFDITIGGGDASVIANENTQNFQTYPNPAADNVQFNVEVQSDVAVILDVLGKEVLRLPTIEGINNINISGLKTGVYILSIFKGSTLVGNSKIIKS